MALSPGDRLGPYEILVPLGAGGMGEVWKARDTRLDRIVAIKVSQGRFSDRFEREARAIAALNHPNVCQLYDVGPNYLVMEFVEGAPLSATDSTRKLLDLAVQIADGLSAAHAVPIVHRDLKPDNILVTRDGRVKILDFGLAKAAVDLTGDASRTMGITDPGVAVGTIAYMSPEQARGEANLTPQSDQFSFGLVLYELAAGKRALQRGTAPETMTAIIREEAEPLPGSLPAPLRWLIERLLAKEPTERYDSTRDLYRELKQIRDRMSEATSGSQAAVSAPAPKRKRLLAPFLAGAVCLVAGAAAAWFALPPTTSGPDLANYQFTAVARDETEELAPKWSPDGKNIAYTARVYGIMQVFTRVLGSADAVQLTKAALDCRLPFWSPDGSTVYFVSGGSLWSVPAAGGATQMLREGVNAATLHPDGKTLAFFHDRKVWIGPLKGGEAKEFWPGPANAGLSFSPDGSELVVGSIGPVWVFPFPSGTPRELRIGAIGAAPSWFPDNRHLAVVARKESDRGRGIFIVDVTDGTRQMIYSGPGELNNPSVSPDGKRIAYSTGSAQPSVLEISIPDGRVRTLISHGNGPVSPDWAPSGTHFLFSSIAGVEDATPEGFSRRLIDAPRPSASKWSPDGTRFIFYTEFKAVSTLTLANASGGGAIVLDSTQAGQLQGFSWSPDGQWISYIRSPFGKRDLVKTRATPGAAPEVLANAGIQGAITDWSPAGDWIAYTAAEGIDLVSPDGKSTRNLTSRKFRTYGFSKDGGQLFGVFQNTSGSGAQWQLYSVNVKTGEEKFLSPIDLPDSVDGLGGFSIHPDGKRFLTAVVKEPYDIWEIEGFEHPRSQNWLARLLHR